MTTLPETSAAGTQPSCRRQTDRIWRLELPRFVPLSDENGDKLNLRRQLRKLIRAAEEVPAALHHQGWSAGSQQLARTPWAEQRVGEGSTASAPSVCGRPSADLMSGRTRAGWVGRASHMEDGKGSVARIPR
jgi:hypothetical protein